MRFLVDECTGPQVAKWLREQGHNVFSVFDEARGTEDDVILQKAFDENRILITNDKDFGQKVYSERRPYRGVILCVSRMNVQSLRLWFFGDYLRDMQIGYRIDL